MHRFAPILLLSLLPVLLATPGCTQPANARLQLGVLQTTPTFQTHPAPTPSSSNAQRPHWDTTVFIAPIDGIAHNPTLRIYRYPRKDDHPRTYGLLPTPSTPLGHQTTPISRTIPDSLDELRISFHALIDPLLFFYELTSTPWSPRLVWKRTRQESAWSSGAPPSPESSQETTND